MYKFHLYLYLIGDYLDILAVSCDSFNEDTNKVIGRGQGRKSHLDKLHQVHNWCRDYKVAFKINSVINTFNVDEDMTEQITALNPVRWKVQLLHYCRLCRFNQAADHVIKAVLQCTHRSSSVW